MCDETLETKLRELRGLSVPALYEVELTDWEDNTTHMKASLVDYTHKRVDSEEPVLYIYDGEPHFIKWDDLKSFSIVRNKV